LNFVLKKNTFIVGTILIVVKSVLYCS